MRTVRANVPILLNARNWAHTILTRLYNPSFESFAFFFLFSWFCFPFPFFFLKGQESTPNLAVSSYSHTCFMQCMVLTHAAIDGVLAGLYKLGPLNSDDAMELLVSVLLCVRVYLAAVKRRLKSAG